jgi:hypothetical protein
VLEVFRLNGRIIASGDALVARIGLIASVKLPFEFSSFQTWCLRPSGVVGFAAPTAIF